MAEYTATTYRQVVLAHLIEGATQDLAVEMACELELASGYDPTEGARYPTDQDLVVALRQPITMAAVFSDLCKLLEVEPPVLVQQALEECA